MHALAGLFRFGCWRLTAVCSRSNRLYRRWRPCRPFIRELASAARQVVLRHSAVYDDRISWLDNWTQFLVLLTFICLFKTSAFLCINLSIHGPQYTYWQSVNYRLVYSLYANSFPLKFILQKHIRNFLRFRRVLYTTIKPFTARQLFGTIIEMRKLVRECVNMSFPQLLIVGNRLISMKTNSLTSTTTTTHPYLNTASMSVSQSAVLPC